MDSLGTIDIVVFAMTLLISAAIGIFFAFRNKHKRSTEEYFFGGRKIHPIPVAASIAVSFVSAIAIISLPVEVYLYGAVFIWNVVAQLIATIVAVIWYVPLYHRLKLSSVYQYLEFRFNRFMRIMASVCSCVNLFLYLGLVIYLPALALSATTSLGLHVAIAITSILCTFYTSTGGMKAVVWTDLIQCTIMVAGMLGVFIKSISYVGGIDVMMDAAVRGGRTNMFKFDFDPRVRSTFWSVSVGLGLNSCFQTGCDQVYIQRYLSCKSVGAARLAVLLTLIPGIFFTLMCVGNGLALFAAYEHCDPFKAGHLERVDQLLPSLVITIFRDVPGMSGLFVAAAYCGTLSSVSSGMNAMSALILNDFIKPFIKDLKQEVEYIVATSLTVLIGILVMSLAYLVSYSPSNIVGLFVSFSGWIAGPLLGVFTMGIFMQWVNSKGAVAGFLCGWLAVGWIGISAMFSTDIYSPEPHNGKLNISTYNCDMNNTTQSYSTKNSTTPSPTDTMTIDAPYGPSIHSTLYSISPFWYGTVGFIVCLIAGNITSLISGGKTSRKMDGMAQHSNIYSGHHNNGQFRADFHADSGNTGENAQMYQVSEISTAKD